MAKPSVADRWEAHTSWAWLVRMVTVLLPVAAGVGAIAVLSRLVPKPGGKAEIGWYLLVFGGSWGTLWLAQRLLTRLLPLAVLLEMSLIFPERAPSRLRVARRAGSASELARMASAPLVGRADETTQQAAERILTLVAALARHDKRTRGHAERVRSYTDVIADRMGLPQADRDRLRWAALLHDIGKLEVPATLLNKPGKPTLAEWEVLRAHPAAGAAIAAPLMGWLGQWGEVIVQHHEKFDGTGYPAGLAGHDIGQGARIVAVADTFEVMTAARSYKRPVRKELALKELVRCAGTQFDPAVVRALVEVPSRRLMLVMGPSAWLAGVPFLGQAPVALAGPIGAQTAAAAFTVATVVGASAVPAQAAPQPVQMNVASAASTIVGQLAAPAKAKPASVVDRGNDPILGKNLGHSSPSSIPSTRPSTPAHHSPSSSASPKPSPSSSVPSHSSASAPPAAPTPVATTAGERSAALAQTSSAAPAPSPSASAAPTPPITHPTVAPTPPITHPTVAPTPTPTKKATPRKASPGNGTPKKPWVRKPTPKRPQIVLPAPKHLTKVPMVKPKPTPNAKGSSRGKSRGKSGGKR
jgi:putative nucleotidyltransferase with HDIG domain